MANVDFSPQARRDLDAIVQDLADNAGLRIARRYATEFEGAKDRLRAFPGSGAPRTEFGPDTRLVIVDPYNMFYDGGPDSETVLVLRILHGRRDITAELIAKGR